MLNVSRPSRRSIRLPGFDYAAGGAYFVTICTWNRECRFGTVDEGEMRVNEAGAIVADTWQWLAMQYCYVQLDAWTVMPNHFHGIIVLNQDGRGGSRTAPTATDPTVVIKPLGRLVGAFKTVSAKQINILQGIPGATVWQRNYYERVIRDDDELQRIRDYIVGNPLNWQEDEEHPARLGVPS